MSPLLALTLLPTSLKADPRIAQDWTAVAATGLASATLRLRPDGRFVMDAVEKGGKRRTIRGGYAVAPGTGGNKRVVLTYDLSSLRAAGMPKAGVDRLARSGCG